MELRQNFFLKITALIGVIMATKNLKVTPESPFIWKLLSGHTKCVSGEDPLLAALFIYNYIVV